MPRRRFYFSGSLLAVKLMDPEPPSLNLFAQPSEATVGGYETEYNFGGQSGDEAVPPAPEVCVRAPISGRERRDDGEPTLLDGAALLGRKPHGADAPGRAQRDWLPAAQQNGQTLLLQRGVQAGY